jgi:uncharacterized protein YcaQ
MKKIKLKDLRERAVARTFFPPVTLAAALEKMGFVQADPIRAPARAQDLILRQRVAGYRAGDLERFYPELGIEEDYLYAYGFMTRAVWRLLHPRKLAAMKVVERKVLEVVLSLGATHPRHLEEHLGRKRVRNAWGGYSKATTRALDDLQWRGLLRIARREEGIRVYEPAPERGEPPANAERLRELARLLAKIFAPTPEKSLHAVLARYARLGNPRNVVAELLQTGELEAGTVDGVNYLWPAEEGKKGAEGNEATEGKEGKEGWQRVRLLAPFDPLVWDRARFEHLWGWPYRFEAYTPPAKRVRGYYALPLLWETDVIGWANVGVKDGRLEVAPGFVGKRPGGKEFKREYEREVRAMGEFLGVESPR